jgi:hypothetical protein
VVREELDENGLGEEPDLTGDADASDSGWAP